MKKSILQFMRNLMMLWNFLLAFYIVYADVIREDGYHNYEGQFTVKNKGRMLRVLMSFRNVKPEECALHCVRHIRCRTFNYRPEKKDCELTDEEFHKRDVDTISHGWYNYGTPKRVNGGWSNWRDFTECTKTCGDGTLKRYRECDSPTPAHGGADCYGKMLRRVKCNIRECPVDGGFSNWKNSTNCTKPCGNGTLDQTRVCDSPKPEHGGADCEGIKNQTVECNTQACPVDGGFSNWKNSTNCTKPCGNGTLDQTRVCDSPKPEHGGADCEGIKKQTVECNTQACPVDGGFSNWKNSTNCTKPCGNGTLDQTRVCDSPKPEHGGADCEGIKKQTVECNTQACPVDGGFSNWKNSTNCTKPCGNGTLDQTRVCDSPKPGHGGADCKGIKKQTVECNTQACPVDGNWSKWKNSTDCTKSCGSGTLKQRRECDFPKPANGGDNCTGIKERTVTCNSHECPQVVDVGKIATQSSIFNPHFSPSKAVDGDTRTRALTKFEFEPWWEVDLGDIKVVKEIRLTASINSGYNKGLLVQTRMKKGENWKTCNDLGDLKIKITSFQCHDGVTKARFLRIRSTETCHLDLNEVEIFDD